MFAECMRRPVAQTLHVYRSVLGQCKEAPGQQSATQLHSPWDQVGPITGPRLEHTSTPVAWEPVQDAVCDLVAFTNAHPSGAPVYLPLSAQLSPVDSSSGLCAGGPLSHPSRSLAFEEWQTPDLTGAFGPGTDLPVTGTRGNLAK